MKVEEFDIRFGTIAVEKGFIRIDQLMDALEVQVREELSGIKHRLIGRIVFDLGFMTFLQIREVLATISSSNGYQITEEERNRTSSRS